MKNRAYIMVNLDSYRGEYGVLLTLIGFWYKERTILDRIVPLVRGIPYAKLAESYDDAYLGAVIAEEGKLIDDFMEFTKSHPFGEFAMDILTVNRGSNYANTASGRIHIDIGKLLKKTDWWKENKIALDVEKAKLKEIRKIMNL